MGATAAHTMTISALMDAPLLQLPQQQQQQQPAAACGSISPVTGGSKMHASVGKRKRKRVVGPKPPRKSRVIYNFTRETLSQYFHLSQREAAKQLGVAAITMKRNCKRQGIMWPYRARKIEAAHRARQEADEVSSSSDGETDSDCDVNDSNERRAYTGSAEPSASASSGEPMSEAALVFARLPFLCLTEAQADES